MVCHISDICDTTRVCTRITISFLSTKQRWAKQIKDISDHEIDENTIYVKCLMPIIIIGVSIDYKY